MKHFILRVLIPVPLIVFVLSYTGWTLANWQLWVLVFLIGLTSDVSSALDRAKKRNQQTTR